MGFDDVLNMFLPKKQLSVDQIKKFLQQPQTIDSRSHLYQGIKLERIREGFDDNNKKFVKMGKKEKKLMKDLRKEFIKGAIKNQIAKEKSIEIFDLIEKNKILENTKNFKIKYLFDPNLKKPQFSSKGIFSNKKKYLINFIKNSNYFVTCIGSEYGKARYLISKELEKKKLKPLEIVSKYSYISNQKLIGKSYLRQIQMNLVLFLKYFVVLIYHSRTIIEYTLNS